MSFANAARTKGPQVGPEHHVRAEGVAERLVTTSRMRVQRRATPMWHVPCRVAPACLWTQTAGKVNDMHTNQPQWLNHWNTGKQMRNKHHGFGLVFGAIMALSAGCIVTGPTDPEPSSEPEPSVAADAGDTEPTDAGTEPTDAGDTEPTDAGTEPTDGGSTEPTDAGGTEPTDAGDTEPSDAGAPDVRGLQVRVLDGDIELEDGQGTSSTQLTAQGLVGADLAGTTITYTFNGAEPQSLLVENGAFGFDLELRTGENTLSVRAEDDRAIVAQVDRTFFGAIGARAGTHDQKCLGPTSPENLARCEELCIDAGGDFDQTWGNIGGCRNIPNSASLDLDFNDPTLPPAMDFVTTHDQQCLGPTSAANMAACEDICTDIGGTYDETWGNIGGCRDIPGSALTDLDFTDGTILPEEPALNTTHDQQCLGPTSAANIARCEELCIDAGGTHDPGWGNIGGCRNIPGSAAVDLDFTDGTLDPNPDEATE